MLNELDRLPEGILALGARELYRLLPGPTLIHLPGKITEPLFVSVLIHGNEESGWEAIRKVLIHHAGNLLPRSLSLFIGNVAAARQGKRFLPGQEDYNRVWQAGDSHEHRIMQQVLQTMQKRQVFISIDVHNTSGRNPHYACINKTSAPFPQLAAMFSGMVVYFLKPDTVQSMAFSKLCPAITIECGPSGEFTGIQRASDFIEYCLRLGSLAEIKQAVKTPDVYHTVAVVKINPACGFGFDDPQQTINLDSAFERYNFHVLPAGTVIGRVSDDSVERPLYVYDESGCEVSADYFTISEGVIRSRQERVPAMITLNREIIRQDCLCYLMERYPLQA